MAQTSRARAKGKSLPPEISPSRYIEKVSLVTGEVLDEDIPPDVLLVNNHRDYHVVDIQAQRFLSRLIRQTGDEEFAHRKQREVLRLGRRTAGVLARALGQKDPHRVSKALFGLRNREYFFRYKKHGLPREEIGPRVERLQQAAAERLAAASRDGRPALRLLVTGGTGFVGQELLSQVARDEAVVEVVVLIRPREIRDRKTKEVIRVESPEERGVALLRRLWLDRPEVVAKFRFVSGDVEQPDFNIAEQELERLRSTLTHVVHCAASVSFEDPYERSFRTNVQGTLNALRFSLGLQTAPDSPFVSHISVETSYIHGRQVRKPAREDQIVFPRNFYNNYYELTKAMASLETERFMFERGLRVVQLCPAIVIGESRAGNNRGDTKVVNAPINVFGLAHKALRDSGKRWYNRTKAAMLARMACIFPGDPTAQINLIPVDRVVQGILAALRRPAAIGRRIHLATDNRLSADRIRKIVRDEIGVRVKLADPATHRTLTLPMVSKLLTGLRQEKLARGLERLGTIFGGYSEWGQPVHEVGNDAEILGLPVPRPNTEHAFRMLCRHNRYVQDFGKVRDADEVARRERIWLDFVIGLEQETGRPAGSVPAELFHQSVARKLDLDRFELRPDV